MPKLELDLVPSETYGVVCVVCSTKGADWQIPLLPDKGVHTHCKVLVEKSPKRSPSGTIEAVKP